MKKIVRITSLIFILTLGVGASSALAQWCGDNQCTGGLETRCSCPNDCLVDVCGDGCCLGAEEVDLCDTDCGVCCVESNWIPGNCQGGTCGNGEREETRLEGCGGELSQCVPDAACCVSNWQDGACGGGGCPANQRQIVDIACGNAPLCQADAACCVPNWQDGACGGGGCPANQRQIVDIACGRAPQCQADAACGGPVCPNGSCEAGENCGNCYDDCRGSVQDHLRCSGGNLWWYDACNVQQAMRQNCGGNGCSNNACEAPAATCPAVNAFGCTFPQTNVGETPTVNCNGPAIGTCRWRCNANQTWSDVATNCCTPNWTNEACGGGSCAPANMQQTDGCGNSRCRANASCAPPPDPTWQMGAPFQAWEAQLGITWVWVPNGRWYLAIGDACAPSGMKGYAQIRSGEIGNHDFWYICN